jgi:hypothetical protein
MRLVSHLRLSYITNGATRALDEALNSRRLGPLWEAILEV